MSASVIKSFLVSLGYKVDATGERKFKDGVSGATDVVNKLGTALKVLTLGAGAYGAFKWMSNMSSGMENMYYAAKRAGDSVKNLQAYTYAASQMGSSVEQALSSAQAMRQWILNNPNAETLLRNNLGVKTRDEKGELLGGSVLSMNVGSKFAGMPTYRQKQYADMMGIPLELRMALAQQGQMNAWQEQYKAMLRKAGLDPDKAAENAKNLDQGARSLKSAFGIVGDAVGASLMGHGGAAGALERFRDMILSHVPQITKIVSKLADAGVTAFGKFLDWLQNVDWDKAFKAIGDFFTWLLGLKPEEMIGYLKQIALVLGILLGINMLSNVLSFAGGLTRLIPLFGGMASGLGAVAAAIGVAGAAVLGYKAGSYIYDNALAGTKAGNMIGSGLAHVAAIFGSTDAQDAINRANGKGPANHSGDFHPERASYNQKGAPRGIRNNNPGNIRYGDFARRMGATGQDASGFAIFPDAATGLRAMTANLGSYAKKGLNTVSGIINRWAPPSENDTGSYVSQVAKRLGVGADQSLNMSDPAVISGLLREITKRENGVNPYSNEMLNKAAGGVGSASTGASPTLNADTTIHVHGSGDPVATANAVAGKQGDVNQRLVRNFRPVFS